MGSGIVGMLSGGIELRVRGFGVGVEVGVGSGFER